MRLSLRARTSWTAHLLKACLKQHHRELAPTLAKFIDADSVIFDVGGHAGQFAKLFSRMVPDGHVYSFEPGSYALSLLRWTVRFNRLRNVTVVPCGLGDQPTTLALSVPIKPSGSIGFGLSHLTQTSGDDSAERRDNWQYHSETVDIRTIDQFVRERQLDRVDFIKADIEGWEMRMLVGAQETISAFEPSLMIEVVDRHLARAGDGAGALFGFLFRLGYRAFVFDAGRSALVEVTKPTNGDIFFCKRAALIAGAID